MNQVTRVDGNQGFIEVYNCTYMCIKLYSLSLMFTLASNKASMPILTVLVCLPIYVGLDEVFNTIKSAIVPSIQSEIVLLTQQLLNYISSNDYDNYVQLVHPSLIAIEPEGNVSDSSPSFYHTDDLHIYLNQSKDLKYQSSIVSSNQSNRNYLPN